MNHVALDIMTTNVMTIGPDATVEEAVGKLLKYRISGVPIIDSNGQLLGIVSEFQLLALVYDDHFKSETVESIMTTDVITVDETTPLAKITDLLIVHRPYCETAN